MVSQPPHSHLQARKTEIHEHTETQRQCPTAGDGHKGPNAGCP